MTVAELKERISSQELTEWYAFYKVDPFGSTREDWRMGVVASILYNVNVKDGNKTPMDFMLDSGKDEELEQSVDKQVGIAHFLGDVVGGLITTKEDREE